MAPRTPRVGLALGGGGVRGLAHLGVLRVLEEAQIPIACIAGTSIGAIFGAMWARGHRAAAMEAEVRRLRQIGTMLRLVDWVPSSRGLMPGHKVYRYLDDKLGPGLTFADLSIPLAVTSVDLANWQEVDFTTGPVLDAVRASMSVPGLFVPVELDGMRLVDGGFLNNVPVDLARALGADIVLAVDVDAHRRHDERPVRPAVDSPFPNYTPSLVLDLWQAALVMSHAVKQCKYRETPPDLLLLPPIPATVGLLRGLARIDAVIDAGEAGMRALLPRLQRLMRDFDAAADAGQPRPLGEAHGPL